MPTPSLSLPMFAHLVCIITLPNCNRRVGIRAAFIQILMRAFAVCILMSLPYFRFGSGQRANQYLLPDAGTTDCMAGWRLAGLTSRFMLSFWCVDISCEIRRCHDTAATPPKLGCNIFSEAYTFSLRILLRL